MTCEEKKRELRKIARRAEAALDDGYRRNSDREIARRLLALREYAEATCLFCFVSTPREIETRAIIEDALGAGKRVCVPLCTGEGEMEAREIRSLEELREGAFGISEPPAEAPRVPVDEIDFAVIPCLACNHAGVRLGRGGGYYDRFLAQYRGGAVLLCRELLIRDEIPAQTHDCPVPWVLTERALYEDGVPAQG
ncbi:MAG: 5-formyltetrahydrofolate cyclo-ligase [Oscillibacter sp.]|nr:5-formyltetrahydrofolate cyclo-ligase [Oscillibacter sp.]